MRMPKDHWLTMCAEIDFLENFPAAPCRPYDPKVSAPNDLPSHDIDWSALNREFSGGGD